LRVGTAFQIAAREAIFVNADVQSHGTGIFNHSARRDTGAERCERQCIRPN
jgi:hypothetical protein